MQTLQCKGFPKYRREEHTDKLVRRRESRERTRIGSAPRGHSGCTASHLGHCQDALLDRFRQTRPCLDDRRQPGVTGAVPCTKCAGFCAAFGGMVCFFRGICGRFKSCPRYGFCLHPAYRCGTDAPHPTRWSFTPYRPSLHRRFRTARNNRPGSRSLGGSAPYKTSRREARLSIAASGSHLPPLRTDSSGLMPAPAGHPDSES